MSEEIRKVIFKYSLEQAEEDGVLVNIEKINPNWKAGPFNYITANLLNKGYVAGEGKLDPHSGTPYNIKRIVDLLNQGLKILKAKTDNFKKFGAFFEDSIELPNGEKERIFICQNETGKFTMLLPEDY